MRKFPCLALAFVVLSACAGGSPDTIQKTLAEKWVGKPADDFFVAYGPAEKSQKLSDGRMLYTWERRSEKYRNNRIMLSKETCIVSFVADRKGIIEKIGRVDDSLGEWHLSYCHEHLRL